MNADDDVFDQAAGVIAQPKADPADSFVLHAPLELLARRALLPLVDPVRQEAARERLAWVAESYAAAGRPMDEPPGREFDSPGAAKTWLGDALAHGDLDAIEQSACWLTAHASSDELAPLASVTLPSLAAAAHAAIYFNLVPRIAQDGRALLRPLVRELGRNPDWRLHWIDERALDGRGGGLEAALLSTPRMGKPGSDFIYPLMHQVDSEGVAAELLGPVLGPTTDLAAATRALLRVAAWSMLQDDAASAPYGWTHCMTLPQAAAGVAHTTADPLRAIAIAATYVVGFRAGLSTRDVVAGYAPDPVAEKPIDALDANPATAAAAVHHAPDDQLTNIETELATRAALHEDAHLAKYTLACFHAAESDPAERRLYLSAAAYLSAWWASVAQEH